MKIQRHTELEVYKKAFDTAMLIFQATKAFPREETYSLTDQIRRSSRSVCANLAEASRKRRYKAALFPSFLMPKAKLRRRRSGSTLRCRAVTSRATAAPLCVKLTKRS
jgi:23S rRNA-intervening sequence protein